MASLQIFLEINFDSANSHGSADISDRLKSTDGLSQIMIVGQTVNTMIKLDMVYDDLQVSLTDIEKIIEQYSGTITSMQVHFPPTITGINDPYSASARSFSLEEEIGNLEGIVSVSTGFEGSIKVKMDPAFVNKDSIVQNIIQILKAAQNKTC